MAPLSPANPRRIMRSVSDVLLRFVVRTTRGMREYGHETHGVAHYLTFGVRLGPAGLLRLGVSFVNAVLELFRLRREHLSPAARAHREEHERRMFLLAEATTVGVERMRAIAALQMAPVTRSIQGILASVLLDRIALGLAAWLALLLVAWLSLVHGERGWFAAPLILVAWAAMHRQSRRTADRRPGKSAARARWAAGKTLPGNLRRDGAHAHAREGHPQRGSLDVHQPRVVGRRGSRRAGSGPQGAPRCAHAPRPARGLSGARRRAPRLGLGRSAPLAAIRTSPSGCR